MAARKTAIEFLPQEDWEKGTGGKILKWSLSIGRHIIIFTEFIVILAFLSRFKLDRDLTDLGEKIKQQQAIVTSWGSFEKEFRLLSKRLQLIEELKTSVPPGEILNELGSLTPIDVVITDLNISSKQLTLDANTLSEGSLGVFLRNLKNSSKFKNVNLTQVGLDTNGEAGIKFQIKGELAIKK